jgi:hypothetical protein
MRAAVDGVRNNFPGLLDELLPTDDQARKFLLRQGIDRPVEARNVNVLFVGGPLLRACVVAFGVKLSCALYYKHTGHILSGRGGIAIRWFSNVGAAREQAERQVAAVLGRRPALQRCSTSLGDQFDYRFDAGNDPAHIIFYAKFRSAFYLLSFVLADAAMFPTIDGMEVLQVGPMLAAPGPA